MNELKSLLGMMLISGLLAFMLVDGCDREAVRQKQYIQEYKRDMQQHDPDGRW